MSFRHNGGWVFGWVFRIPNVRCEAPDGNPKAMNLNLSKKMRWMQSVGCSPLPCWDSENFSCLNGLFSLLKYVIPKSLKFSHWPSKDDYKITWKKMVVKSFQFFPCPSTTPNLLAFKKTRLRSTIHIPPEKSRKILKIDGQKCQTLGDFWIS